MADASEDDCYAAMDWLVARQDRIQQKLAARHLQDGGLVLYDLTSSYFEGACCPLAKRGYSRDGKRGTLHVNYVVITNAGGCPVAVSVYDGNTADSRTLLPAVQQVRADFGIAHVVRVGDVPPSEGGNGISFPGILAGHHASSSGVPIGAIFSNSTQTRNEIGLFRFW